MFARSSRRSSMQSDERPFSNATRYLFCLVFGGPWSVVVIAKVSTRIELTVAMTTYGVVNMMIATSD